MDKDDKMALEVFLKQMCNLTSLIVKRMYDGHKFYMGTNTTSRDLTQNIKARLERLKFLSAHS